LRARRQLEERLEQARRDSRKFQTELQQAQKEAESYKDRLQAIKEKDTEDEPAVGSISGVSSGDQFARQLFIQPGSLEVVMFAILKYPNKLRILNVLVCFIGTGNQ
jgi:hypothetical protein